MCVGECVCVCSNDTLIITGRKDLIMVFTIILCFYYVLHFSTFEPAD